MNLDAFVETDLVVYRGDITRLQVDAIVNAANRGLLGGGGVDGAIHRAAGPELLQSCRKLGGCETGEVKVTPGFKLEADYVLHAVGPVWEGGQRGEPELLASCYRNCMALAADLGLKTLAFPAISCGVYRFPLLQAAQIAVREVKAALTENGGSLGAQLQQVIFCVFDGDAEAAYEQALKDD